MIHLDISNVEFSRNDKRFQTKLPTKLTPNLAYETGVHIGDGHMNYYSYQWGKVYEINYSGNLSEELLYYEIILKPLLESLYGKKVKVEKRKKNECRIQLRSKAILFFKKNVLGITLSPKDNIFVPFAHSKR